jgi:hypothetical protein
MQQLFEEPGMLSRHRDLLCAGRPRFDSRQGLDFSLDSVQINSGAHPASYKTADETSFIVDELAEA